MPVEPTPQIIKNAASLPRWWVYESQKSRAFTKRDRWKNTNTIYFDERAAERSVFAGTFIRVRGALDNRLILVPYEFYRPSIVQYFVFTLRSRMETSFRKRGWIKSELPMTPSTMAVKLLGCTPSEAVEHLESLMVGEMSWSNKGQWHIDHIIPLCSFDLRDISQAAQACNHKNLQPLWARDNLRKHAKTATVAAHH